MIEYVNMGIKIGNKQYHQRPKHDCHKDEAENLILLLFINS